MDNETARDLLHKLILSAMAGGAIKDFETLDNLRLALTTLYNGAKDSE